MKRILLSHSKVLDQSRKLSISTQNLSRLRELAYLKDVDIEQYRTDWTGAFQGGGAVIFPDSTETLVSIIKFCNQEKLNVVVQGGNTGLVGGGVGSSDSDLIISMSKMCVVLVFTF